MADDKTENDNESSNSGDLQGWANVAFRRWPNNESGQPAPRDPTAPFGFLDLPGEIRNRIYAIILKDYPAGPKIFSGRETAEGERVYRRNLGDLARRRIHEAMTFRATCRQIRWEFGNMTTPLLWFHFVDFDELIDFLSDLTPTTRNNLRHLNISNPFRYVSTNTTDKGMAKILEASQAIDGLHPDCILTCEFHGFDMSTRRPYRALYKMQQGEKGLKFAKELEGWEKEY
ncbi:hypothetical protein EJ08DRAFT_655632 [Tothia fuscella]|uniref:Uncharacterized protein n=1 Tax=Tothia fuscella TaxID=1048955 RepID=A0A9P4P4C8_9PEZI|nr:hypothetical protein EJ08DRAFT_655632 [Tothia fuscella]